ncbi:hypothetical protein GOODEAATRI_024639 [Goodea atripinnis]|uniref:C3H1-type domain-containing protein n=1 Tax=Goodea atripinnis TaxID=208336 RepID=A0ABV0PGQ3_9TELE
MLTIHRYVIRQLLSHTSAAKYFQQRAWKIPVNRPHWNCFAGFSVCQKGVVSFPHTSTCGHQTTLYPFVCSEAPPLVGQRAGPGGADPEHPGRVSLAAAVLTSFVGWLAPLRLKSADRVPAGISLGVSLKMSEGEDFTEQPIVGLSDKIPLVKPYFRKKQRKLDPKCIQRALDPILTSLLSTDTLVSGDGVFVPRSQPGRTPGTLCAAAVVKQSCVGQVCLKDPGAAEDATAPTGVQGLMNRDVDVEIADTTAELEETERPQLKPGLRAAGSTETITPPGRNIPPVTPPVPHQEGTIIKGKDLLTSGAKSVPVKDSSAIQDPHSQLLQSDKGVLFLNKSEEASLDLVFELLTQLQYHTHQSDSVDICVDFLQGRCVFGNDCAHHHTVLPYHWQIRRSSTQTWQSIADDAQEQLERLYCNPDQEQVRLKYQ